MKLMILFVGSLFFSAYLQAEVSNQNDNLNCHKNLNFNVKNLFYIL